MDRSWTLLERWITDEQLAEELRKIGKSLYIMIRPDSPARRRRMHLL